MVMWHWFVDTSFGSRYLTITWICNIMLQALTLAGKCEISHRLPCGSDGRSVTWPPKFLGWTDNQIVLVLRLRYNFILGESYQRILLNIQALRLVSCSRTIWHYFFFDTQPDFIWRNRAVFSCSSKIFIMPLHEGFVEGFNEVDGFNKAETSCRIAHILVISPSHEQLRHSNISSNNNYFYSVLFELHC